jgi:hypothetical protein
LRQDLNRGLDLQDLSGVMFAAWLGNGGNNGWASCNILQPFGLIYGYTEQTFANIRKQTLLA